MKKISFSSVILLAVCGLAFAMSIFSVAMAEEPNNIYQADAENLCTQESHDTDMFEGPQLSSELPALEEAKPEAQFCLGCSTSADCFGPGACDRRTRCCIFY